MTNLATEDTENTEGIKNYELKIKKEKKPQIATKKFKVKSAKSSGGEKQVTVPIFLDDA